MGKRLEQLQQQGEGQGQGLAVEMVEADPDSRPATREGAADAPGGGILQEASRPGGGGGAEGAMSSRDFAMRWGDAQAATAQASNPKTREAAGRGGRDGRGRGLKHGRVGLQGCT